jgi:hypothetical protein
MESQTATPTPAPEAVDRAGRPLPTEEKMRLAKGAFPTMVAPLADETVDELRGWREPAGAYVMLESTKIHLMPGALKRVGTGLTFVDVSEVPDQQTKIEFYIRKGGRILHWGKFPKATSPDAKDKEKAQIHNNAWDRLEVFLKQKLIDSENQGRVKVLEAEVDALRRKVAENDAKKKIKEAA